MNSFLLFIFEDWCKCTFKKSNKQSILSAQTKIAGAGSKVSGTDPRISRSIPNCHGSTERKWAFPGAGPAAPWAPPPACWAQPAEPPAPAQAQPPHCPRPGHTQGQYYYTQELLPQLLLQPSHLTVLVLVTQRHNLFMFWNYWTP